ncbi:uncharacterized protein BDV17DRAFT_6837 [Aspergillus undulatus]|uniref:uncharacterized protein n=1 Tax=Aspergillus undulatus TaxID=1810928 RepID=UPI003CCCC281
MDTPLTSTDQSLAVIAPKPLCSSSSLSSDASTPPGYAVFKPKSCLACRKRKVRCDRQLPCANCSRWSIECIFPSPIRKCSRARTKPDARRHGDQALHDRIHILEAQVSQLTETVNAQADRLRSPATLGGSIFPLSHTWAHSTASLHPPLVLGRMYWHVFLEWVDPLIKVVHRPSASKILRRGLDDPTSLNEGQCALLQVIYLACISAMDTTDVQASLQISKGTALSTYRMAAEQALARAGFMTTDDWTTLQALVLFIAISRLQNDHRSAWNLSGLAERLDLSIEEDSSNFGAEMRRRVRSHLWYLNRRIRDDRGQSFDSFSQSGTSGLAIELPSNCHDAELCADMTAPPSSHSGWTAMSFCLLRYELATAERIVESDTPWLLKTKAVRECQGRLESQYLRHCDGTEPIHWLATHISYVMITEMWMKLYSPQFTPTDTPGSSDLNVRDQLFDAAVDILDTQKRLEDEAAARKWEWTLGGYLQYVPLTFLLNELRWRPNDPRADAAWEVAQKSFERWSEDAKKSPPGVMLTELIANARSARQEAADFQYIADSFLLPNQTVFDEFLTDSTVYGDTVAGDNLYLGLPAEWSAHQF